MLFRSVSCCVIFKPLKSFMVFIIPMMINQYSPRYLLNILELSKAKRRNLDRERALHYTATPYTQP